MSQHAAVSELKVNDVTADEFLVGADELPALIERGALLVDVRPLDHPRNDGPIEGAFVADQNDLARYFGTEAPIRSLYPDALRRTIVLFCVSSRGSAPVVLILRELGFTAVYHVRGGASEVRRVLEPDGR